MALAEYLDAAAGRRVDWRTWDCARFLAGWVEEQTGLQLGASWWPKYSTAPQWRRLVRAGGGLVAVFDGEAQAAGLMRHALPYDAKPGDAAVVLGSLGNPFRRREPAGALRTGIGWATLRPGGGLFVGQFEPLAAWRIRPCLKP